MKAIICEICGSHEFIKQDGIYLCEVCGTKYSVEEISALVREVSEEELKTSQQKAQQKQKEEQKKVDAAELELQLHNARTARDAGDLTGAAKLYETIFKQAPSSWEAAFYGAYIAAKQCTIFQLRSVSHAMRSAVSTSLNLIRSHGTDRAQQISAVTEVAGRATEISDQLYNMAREHYAGLDEESRTAGKQVVLNDCTAAKEILYSLGNDIDALFPDFPELGMAAADAWKAGIEKDNGLLQFLDYKEAARNAILEYVPKIQKYDGSYQPPELKEKKRGCYIATAVYGGYDCPQVWTLRRFQDERLAAAAPGRLLIRCYYAVSPALVRLFGKNRWFQAFWRALLDPLVRRLNAGGMENTPYRDRDIF